MASYMQPGLNLGTGATGDPVRDLQRDLRSLGYLKSGIDGSFGSGTGAAVRALQHDLLHNDGTGRDGAAPVRLVDYNKDRVTAVTGAMDQNLAACIADMLADPKFPPLPRADDPAAANAQVLTQLAAMPPQAAPVPFLMAIFKQESDLKQFHEPGPGDEDSFVVVGLDRNGPDTDAVTSRGYGVGQYTLFHHPPRADEVAGVISDLSGNVKSAAGELQEKFARFVNGPADKADDRLAEIGAIPLRACKHAPDDPRYMRDCKQCLTQAGAADLQLAPTQYYAQTSYPNVPIRKNFGCDWPYAVRRYNGSGPNSYHYQARVLLHLAAL